MGPTSVLFHAAAPVNVTHEKYEMNTTSNGVSFAIGLGHAFFFSSSVAFFYCFRKDNFALFRPLTVGWNVEM